MSVEDRIKIDPIGYVQREKPDEDAKDRSIISRVVLDAKFTEGLMGIDEFSHIYVIFWLDKIERTEIAALKNHVFDNPDPPFIGIFATREPIRPNPIGQSLVELVKREENVLWVRGLDAHDGTPVLDIKPYPDWEQGNWIIVKELKAPD